MYPKLRLWAMSWVIQGQTMYRSGSSKWGFRNGRSHRTASAPNILIGHCRCFSKGFDDTNPLGPAIVSAKAIPDPQVVDLKATLNENIVQSSNTK
jgi:Fumarylacetoacetate (FAA) hydrolase family